MILRLFVIQMCYTCSGGTSFASPLILEVGLSMDVTALRLGGI